LFVLRISGTVVIPYNRKVHKQCSYIHCSPCERRFPFFYVFLHCLMWYVYFHLINQYCHHNQITDFVFNCTPFSAIIMKRNDDKTYLWLRSLQFGNLWELLNRMTSIFTCICTISIYQCIANLLHTYIFVFQDSVMTRTIPNTSYSCKFNTIILSVFYILSYIVNHIFIT